ncbi:Hypothetical predicted protein [Lecanosticta acicola]|uniref:Vacuolar protein sorting-associated protein 51 homolog n=1 Tax=Lecanosticta acicola TaxID=111012 RepID=A0AAI8Z4D3_9PEZI|nr:Hypothetical predicted protein [Lecanosticta acicola]
MSTIASPRPSISLSSRRNSASSTTIITSNTTNTTNRGAPSGSGTAAERGALRRNRAALRDYYNLQPVSASSPATSTPELTTTPTLDPTQESELDKPGFNTSSYISNLLSTENLENVLRVEAGLVSDIRTLDGEKKALVYDNYSKLIAATDTIRHMREKIDPLTPTTSTLSPAIGHIAETASALTQDLRRANGGAKDAGKERQRALVRWVLSAPERIGALDGEQAEKEWKQVDAVLERWEGVKGVEDIRRRCLEAL